MEEQCLFFPTKNRSICSVTHAIYIRSDSCPTQSVSPSHLLLEEGWCLITLSCFSSVSYFSKTLPLSLSPFIFLSPRPSSTKGNRDLVLSFKAATNLTLSLPFHLVFLFLFSCASLFYSLFILVIVFLFHFMLLFLLSSSPFFSSHFKSFFFKYFDHW